MTDITRVIAGLLLTCAVSGAVAAEVNYPSKPIRLVTPFGAGGPSDTMARLVSQKLHDRMGQPIIVDNRGAAGGIVGFEIAAKSPPDGYTLLLGSVGGLTMNPSLYVTLPYDPARDFEPVTQLELGPYFLVVHPSVAAKSVQELIALAKAKPGQINFASAGTGNRLAAELFKAAAGIDIVNVAYKGTGQAFGDLIGGQVQMMMANLVAAAPQVKAGKLRGLGVTGLRRTPLIPDMPTIAESGLPGFEAIGWHGILVPAKTPKPVVMRLYTELAAMLSQPDVKERFVTRGIDPVGSTPEAFSAYIKEQTIKYSKLIKQIGIKAE